MPLPQPNLDDKDFTTLVEEATRLIPRHAPEWTDHNRHDPGITFIELFAWLAEMQQYHLNRVGDESYLKFLKLLGIRVREAASAIAEISFKTQRTTGVVVPRGTKLWTADKMIFETSERLTVLPITLKKVFTFAGTTVSDNTDQNGVDGLAFYAFGEEAEAGSRLYLGFDAPFPQHQIISLNIRLDEDYRVALGTHGDEQPSIIPSARVVWEYYDDTNNWSPLELNAEFEAAFADFGEADAAGRCYKPKQQLLRRIKTTLSFKRLTREAQSFFERAVQEANSLTELRARLYDTPALMLKRDETLMLSQTGRIFFPAPEAMGKLTVHPAPDPLYWLRARVLQSGYELPPRIDTVQINSIPAFQRDTLSETRRFRGSGEATNVPLLAESYLALKGANLVQVREGDVMWRDWTEVKSFKHSGPNDPHYVLTKDEEQQRAFINFGDGEHGKIPPAGEDQIRLISYQPAYEERRYIGRSNGLPRQSFMLDQFPAIVEGFGLQVEERIELTPDSIEETNVTCLLRFRRIIPSRVHAGQNFEVRIELEAQQELCEVDLTETLLGELSLGREGKSHPEFDVGDKHARLTIRGLRAGQTLTRTYHVMTGGGGGSIHGKVVISTAYQCPTVVQTSPVSVVETGSEREVLRWRDWERVEDFDASGPDDPHFVLDATTGRVTFGDGVNGRIPQAYSGASGQLPQPSSSESGGRVRVIAYASGGGAAGNVAAGQIARIAEVYHIDARDLSGALDEVKNEGAATGGSEREELEDAEARARRDLKTCYQAVTSADYETLTLATPGLRVARARAIPLFAPGLANYPTEIAPASVTVVVVPYSTALKPVPSPEFLRTVCRHLDRHRLVTTQVHAVAPHYVRVSVRATVLLSAGFDPVSTTAEVDRQLNNFLRPLPAEDDPDGEGWPFGRAVYKSEVYQLIESVEGVDCVEKVTLEAEGTGALRNAQGNILIPPLSLVYAGEHTIEIVTPTPECRSAR